MRNVRSETLTTLTPSTAAQLVDDALPVRLVARLEGDVARDGGLADLDTSMAPMSPPAFPIADVTLPSIPGG